MSSQNPTIAIFGATGGCSNGVLVNALRNGVRVVALARTPSKLTSQLQAQGLSEDILSSQLTIITGDALDVTAVKSALTANKSDHLVSHIVSGIGARPSFRWKWSNPLDFIAIDNPDICANGARTLIKALAEIYATTPSLAERKPDLTFVSTTGISNGPDDVPFLLRPLYHVILALPHKDKRDMEAAFRDNMAGKDGRTAVFGGVIGIRPTLLTGGCNADEGIGHDKIRAGTEAAPVLGWTVCRADVGRWMWENVISDGEKRMRWEGDNVTLAN